MKRVFDARVRPGYFLEERGFIAVRFSRRSTRTSALPDLSLLLFYSLILFFRVPASPVDAAVWYVNDTSMTGDSFTSAIGYDTNDGLTSATPKRNLPAVMPLLSAGDTVFMDSGVFSVADSLVITANSVSLIGKDSISTTINFLDSTAVETRALTVKNANRILLRDLGVRNAKYGVYLMNADTSIFERIRVHYTYQHAIFVDLGSDSNRFDGNEQRYIATGAGILIKNSSYNHVTRHVAGDVAGTGIFIWGGNFNTATGNSLMTCQTVGVHLQSSNNNMIVNNTLTSHAMDGILADAASAGNAIIGNQCLSNARHGIYLSTSTSNNIVVGNLSRNNVQHGFHDIGASGNVYRLNVADSNGKYGYHVRSAALVMEKNSYLAGPTNPDSGLYWDSASASLATARWWWGTTDTTVVKRRIWGPGRNLVGYIPFRLGSVDTAPGADTVAPRAPDTVVAAPLTYTSIQVSWSAVTVDEEADPNPVNLAGYRIYRSPVAETSVWILRGTVSDTNAHTFDDTGIAYGETWFYKVTSYDNWPIVPNEAWYSDSSTGSATVVIDASGPNIWYVNDTATTGDSFTSVAGDNSFSGLFPSAPKKSILAVMPLLTAGDTVLMDSGVFTVADSLVITANSVSLIGKDSISTMIDFLDSTAVETRALTVSNASRVLIRDLGIRNAKYGVYFINADTSVVERTRVTRTYQHANFVDLGSDSNRFEGNEQRNIATGAGILIKNSSYNHVTRHVAGDVAGTGIFIWGGTFNRATENILSTCQTVGVHLQSANSNFISSNTMTSHAMDGILADGGSAGNVIVGNQCLSNARHGIYLSTSTSNNIVVGNLSRNNVQHGFHDIGASGNVYRLNVADSNGQYGYHVRSAGLTMEKNSYLAGPTNPDSGLYWDSASASLATARWWWGTTDTTVVKRRIWGPGRNLVGYIPFRLGLIDTNPGNDTVAPRAPDTTMATALTSASIKVTWSAVTLDEESDNYSTNVTSFRVFRSRTADTSCWEPAAVVSAPADSATLTGLDSSTTYFFKVTATDNWPVYPNESWYSDSTASATTQVFVDTTGPNIWYVNDTSTVGDSYTSAVGNDANNGLTPATPKRTIASVVYFLTAGDSVLIDSGVYMEADTIRISVDTVTILGKDSSSTIIDFADTSLSGFRCVHIRDRYFVRINGVAIRNAHNGIYAINMDSSLIEQVSVSNCGNNGVLFSSCDSSTIRASRFSGHSPTAIEVWFSNNCRFVENELTGNASGLRLNVGGSANWVERNWSHNNSANGIIIDNATGNIIIGNTCESNSIRGLFLFADGVTANMISGNVMSKNAWGIYGLYATNNIISNNLISANTAGGIYSDRSNAILQNQIDSNLNWAITPSADTISKNNIVPAPSGPDSFLYRYYDSVSVAVRNWWGSTDSIRLKSGMRGAGRDSIIYIPFRLGPVDTAPGADTIAPRSPDTVAASGFDTRTVVVTWSQSTINEEIGSALADLAGYRIYRARTADSSYWHRLGSVAASTRSFADSSCQPESTWFYRVTAFDNHAPYENEGFYSDSIVSATTPGTFTFITKVNLDRVETRAIPIVLRWEPFVSNAPVLYRIQIGIDSGFTRLVMESSGIAGTSFAFTPPSDSTHSRFLWRIIAVFESSSFATPPGSFTLDTTPPSVPVLAAPADAGSATSFLVPYVWTASVDSAPANNALYAGLGPRIASYRLAVSRNSSFTDTVIDQSTTDTGVTPSYVYSNGQMYYWRVRAVDLAGNSSPYSAARSFTKSQPVDTAPPAQVPGLFAQPLDTGAILVRWTASPSLSMDSGHYRISWDSGSGGTPSTLIETRAHVAGAAYSYLTAILTHGVTYTFKIVAVSGSGVQDSGLAIVKATARLVSNSAPELRWITPKSEKQNVNKTGVVHCEVGPIDHNDPDLANLGKVRFQYRAVASASFSDMLLAQPDKEANPENYRGSGNIGINWLASGLADGQYELRAIPILSSGTQVDANAVFVNIQLTGNSADAHDSTSHDNASNKTTHEEKLHGNSDTISATLPTKEKANIVLDSSAIPLNSAGQAPKLVIALSNILPQDSALPDSTKTCGPVVDVKFSTLEQPKGEVTIEISLPPLDNRGRALVGNRKIPLNQLKCYRHNGSSWVELTNFTIDTAAGVIRIRSSNFSLFRAAAPETNLVPALTPPPLDSPASTFRTRGNSMTIRWLPSQDEDTTTVRYRLQFSTTSSFATLTYDSTNIVETGALVNLPANTPLHWRVISSNGQGETQISSATRTVIIDTAPPAVAAVAFPPETYPRIAARNSTRLSWNAASDSDYVDSYRVQLWRSDTSGAPIADSALSSAQLQATIAQLPPDTYVWRLWAADVVANEGNSGYKTFRVFRNGDVTEDGNLNADDYFSVGRSFGGAPSAIPLGDLDLDGDIDLEDVRIILGM